MNEQIEKLAYKIGEGLQASSLTNTEEQKMFTIGGLPPMNPRICHLLSDYCLQD